MKLVVIFGPACAPNLRADLSKNILKLKGDRTSIIDIEPHIFADGEFKPHIPKNLRGTDVYIVQPTNAPAENLEYLELLLDAASRATAGRVTAVVPYLRGARQDRKDQPRVPITAKVVSNRLEQAMIAAERKHVMLFHPHFSQIQGFFDISSDLLYPTDIFIRILKKTIGSFKNVVFVAADVGAVKMAEIYATATGTDYAVCDKRRDQDDHVYIKSVIGKVRNKICIIVEDIIDTGGTINKAALKLKEKGASDIYVCATHGILAGKALENLGIKQIEQVFITDSIFHKETLIPKIKIVPCGNLLAEAIWRNNTNSSISAIDGMFSRK